MASELQRRKVAPVFNAMDLDRDGFLEEEDFAALAARWTATRDLAPGSPGHTRLTEIGARPSGNSGYWKWELGVLELGTRRSREMGRHLHG